MRPLVVISSQNAASQNIKENLFRFQEMEECGRGFWSSPLFDMAEYADSIVEIVPSHEASYCIFASTHRSETGRRGFSVHTPGNWGDAGLGGQPRTLNWAVPSKIKLIAQKMKELSAGSLNWQVSVEVDHHGPTLGTPAIFAEIGSSEAEWRNKEAGRIVAEAILEAVACKASFPCHIAFGGTHYSPRFTPIVLDGKVALGHIISGYALERWGVDEEMVGQAWEKNVEKPQSALIDWKGIKGETRRKLIGVLESLGIPWERA